MELLKEAKESPAHGAEVSLVKPVSRWDLGGQLSDRTHPECEQQGLGRNRRERFALILAHHQSQSRRQTKEQGWGLTTVSEPSPPGVNSLLQTLSYDLQWHSRKVKRTLA